MGGLYKKYKKSPEPLKASFWFVICTFVQSGISVLTTPIFTRILTTSEYGSYSVFNSWLSIITVFVSLNIFSATYTQGLVKFEEDKEYSSSMQGLLFSLCVCAYIIYFLFQEFWNTIFELTTIQVISMLGMIWATSVFNLWAAEQRVRYKYKSLVLITIITSLLKPTVGIWFVTSFQDKVSARIVGLLIVEIILFSWIFVYEMERGRVFFSKKYWKYTLSLSIPLVPHYLSQTILSSADRIMIKYYAGASAAGIYSLASSVAQIMTLFSSAILQTVNPWIFKKIKGNKIEEIGKVAYIALSIISLLNIGLIALAPEIILLFGSSNFQTAVWLIPPIAISTYFMFAYSLFASFEFYFEKTKYISISTFFCAILNINLNYIFIQKYGHYAAAYTTLFCYFIYTFVHYISMSKIIKKEFVGRQPYKLKILLLLTISFILISFVFMVSYNSVLLRYFLCVVSLMMLFVMHKKIWKCIIILKETKSNI